MDAAWRSAACPWDKGALRRSGRSRAEKCLEHYNVAMLQPAHGAARVVRKRPKAAPLVVVPVGDEGAIQARQL